MMRGMNEHVAPGKRWSPIDMKHALGMDTALISATVLDSSVTPWPTVVERVASCSSANVTAPDDGSMQSAVGVRNRFMMRTFERIAETFHSAGVPLMALKGAALNLLLYPRLDARRMDDLDLLVHPNDLDKAVSLLRELGAQSGEPLVRENFCPRFHYEVDWVMGDIFPVKIDLHVRPFRPLRYARIIPDDELWNRARQVPVGKAIVFVPSAEDMLIHLAAHSAIHGNSREMWLRDIKLWADAHRLTLDWNRLLGRAVDWRLALPVAVGFDAAMRTFGRVCPDEVMRQLDNAPTNWRDRLVLWQSPRDADHPVAHVLCNAICTPDLGYSLAYLLAVAWPSRPHIARWYRRRHWGWYPCGQVLRCVAPPIRYLARPIRRLLQAIR
jgi:hypothetical protein